MGGSVPSRPVRALQDQSGKFHTGPGSRQKNTKSYTWRRESAQEPKRRIATSGNGADARLRAVHGQHRPAAGRSEAARISRRDDRQRRATGERFWKSGARQTRCGYCKSMPGAVPPFKGCGKETSRNRRHRLSKDSNELFNTILEEEGLSSTAKDSAERLQPAAYLHLPAPDGRRRHLPDRQELPHQRRDDREVLRVAYQEHAGRSGHQRHAAQAAGQNGGSR